jgi:Na+/melibiose symporter-like transporter
MGENTHLESSTASADAAPVEAVVVDAVDAAHSIDTSFERERARSLSRMALLLALGWLGTNVALSISEFTLKFELKDRLGLDAAGIAGFFFVGQVLNYFKSLFGVLTDGVPLFGTRRFHYLLLGVGGGGILWIALGLVPRTYAWLLPTYTLFYMTVVLTSTTLGGRMVEVGNEHNAAGRLTAQRVGMFKVAALIGGPIAGYLAGFPFILSVSISALIHFALLPMIVRGMGESRTAKVDFSAWESIRRQGRALVRSRTLLAAAVMVFLLAASPGFDTPLLFHQTNHLGFSKQLVGNLVLVSAATGMIGATVYFNFCRKWKLRTLLVCSILAHVIGTGLYLFYRDVPSAVFITALEGLSGVLTMLPVYDLAARATPRGSEALGYSIMMSVWNATNKFSDYTGSLVYKHLDWSSLVFINAGTTALMLVIIPFLPVAILNRREGD